MGGGREKQNGAGHASAGYSKCCQTQQNYENEEFLLLSSLCFSKHFIKEYYSLLID